MHRNHRRASWIGGLVIAVSMAALAPWSAPARAQTASPAAAAPTWPAWYWRDAARRDLRAARAAIHANSPILHVERDSAAMRAWLDEGFRRAEDLLPRVTDEIGYRYLLAYYLNGFRDGHISAGHHDRYRPAPIATRSWPGIAMRWARGRYEVSFVAPWVTDGPSLGAVLLDCDGRPAEALARERLDLFLTDLDQPLNRRRFAPVLLWDRENPFVEPIRNCRFRGEDGRIGELTLDYRPATSDDGRAQAAAAAGALSSSPALDVARWGDDGWWIGLPSFGSGDGWEPFFAKIETNLDAIRAARVVVIDVRGNGGGDSAYAERLGRILWGADLLERRRPALGPVLWRATPENRDRVQSLIERMQNDETARENIPWLTAVRDGMDEAVAGGRALYREEASAPSAATGPEPANPLGGTIVLLTDERCFSACLDLMDLFTAMPGTVQAGAPTGADTIFMETNGGILPSGMLGFSYGVKAWVERPRGSNVAYAPTAALTYAGDPADEEGWRRWLAETLRTIHDPVGAPPRSGPRLP